MAFADEDRTVRDQLRRLRRPGCSHRVARHAEHAVFASVWTGERIVLPDPEPHGVTMPPTPSFLDTIVALTLVASHTTTIRVASGIVLPLRNPTVLAKELASVDVASGARLIAGFAAAMSPRSSRPAGFPWGRAWRAHGRVSTGTDNAVDHGQTAASGPFRVYPAR